MIWGYCESIFNTIFFLKIFSVLFVVTTLETRYLLQTSFYNMEKSWNFYVIIHTWIFTGICTVLYRYLKQELHLRNMPLIDLYLNDHFIPQLKFIHKTSFLIFTGPYHHYVLNTTFKMLWLKLEWNLITFPPGNKSQCWPNFANWTGLIFVSQIIGTY